METTHNVPSATINAENLLPHLKACGYTDSLIERSYDFSGKLAPLAAFADTPHDARSACIAVVDAPFAPVDAVTAVRPLGAPVVFACHRGNLQWWVQTTGEPRLFEIVSGRSVGNFFRDHRAELSPRTVFEAKTFRRLPGQTQLSFVDAGLMPFVERSEGERLSRCVESAFRDIEKVLGRSLKSASDSDNAIKATFWLLGAKTLRDKAVDGFKTLDLTDVDDVFERVGRHYGVPGDVPPAGRAWRDATLAAAKRFSSLGNLRNMSAESLAHVYENALVTPAVRKANGTHSTPGPLVDYIVWQLWPWIEQLPPDRRHVFEPACGHGAFLVSALRVLRQWSEIDSGEDRHEYLKKHLHGVEYDPFALEVARLRLTLADIPHGNRWDLKRADMFLEKNLEIPSRKCGVLLANPPYERFSKPERDYYLRKGTPTRAVTKACEMLRRTIPHLDEGASFGVVVPRGLLQADEANDVRRTILASYELYEIDIFEDKLFGKADHEVAVLMGRRKAANRSPNCWFRRLRNKDISAFNESFSFSSQQTVATGRFADSSEFYLPELDEVWRYLSGHPILADVASVSKGLDHKGEALPVGCWRIHDPPLPDDPLGYANVETDLSICGTPRIVGINLDSCAVGSYRAGRPYGKPQVLVNYGPVSRDQWRIKATLDDKGLATTSRLVSVRPKRNEVKPLHLWAILNSPLANAFVYSYLGKRDILVGTLRKMPVPRWSPIRVTRIEEAASKYRALATAGGPLLEAGATPEGVRQAILAMDAAVLQAYDLPPRLERQLLDLFTGGSRGGVGCPFTGYYPPGFTSCLPLHLLISGRLERARADVTADRLVPGQSQYVQDILATAVGNKDTD